MKKISVITTVFIIYLLSPTKVAAQYFSRHLDFNNCSEYGGHIFQVGDSFIIQNHSLCGESHQIEAFSIFRVDLNGEIIWQKEIDELKLYTPKAILPDGNNFFLICAPPVSQGQLDKNIILRAYNLDGELLNEWAYGEDEIEEYPTAIAKLNNYILIVEKYTQASTGKRKGFILFIDDETFEVKRKIAFNDNFSSFFARYLLVDSEGNILLPMIGLYNSLFTGQLIKYDSTGTKLWETDLNSNDYFWNLTIDVAELQNGNYAVGWHSDDYNHSWPAIVYGVSGAGEILWHRTLPDTVVGKNIDRIFSTQNGDVIGLGLDFDIGGGYEFDDTGGWIFRLNQEGEVLWERTIVDISLEDVLPFGQFLLGGTEMDNGDLVFTGLIQDTFPNADPFINNPNTWLLRLDNEGCLVPNCGSLQVIVGDSVFTDIKEVPTFEEDVRVKLFPNPVSDKMTIDIEGDFSFDKNNGANIFIYDIEGRLSLFQKAKAFPKEIDISNLANGLYFTNIGGRFVTKFIKQ